MKHKNVYIISACRTGIGSFNGQFRTIPATKLGAEVIKLCLQKVHLIPSEISEVIMGQVLTAGYGQNPSYQAAVEANIPIHVPAFTVNMLSGSGLKAVHLGYQAICNADADLVVCGGQENSTMAKHVGYIRRGADAVYTLVDSLYVDGLIDAFTGLHTGQIAEHLAQTYKISREAQDKFAYESQAKAAAAVQENYFSYEIAPVLQISTDEFVKPISLKALLQLPVIFEHDPKKNPSITAGNSADAADGAAVLILCSEEQVVQRDLIPFAKIVAFAQIGLDSLNVGLGPLIAIQNVLKLANWTKDEVDLYEIDETFAVQALIVIEQLDLDRNKVNVTGGAIAFGDPLGASGARILVTMIYNLHRLKKNKGVASVCVGGGMGLAIAVERPYENLVI